MNEWQNDKMYQIGKDRISDEGQGKILKPCG